MRVLITGSTSWTDIDALRREFCRLPIGTVIVTGDTSGVDSFAIEVAAERGFSVEAMEKNAADAQNFPEDSWKGLNHRMISTGVDLVLAFHADYGKIGLARGTQHALELADRAGIPTRVFLA